MGTVKTLTRLPGNQGFTHPGWTRSSRRLSHLCLLLPRGPTAPRGRLSGAHGEGGQALARAAVLTGGKRDEVPCAAGARHGAVRCGVARSTGPAEVRPGRGGRRQQRCFRWLQVPSLSAAASGPRSEAPPSPQEETLGEIRMASWAWAPRVTGASGDGRPRAGGRCCSPRHSRPRALQRRSDSAVPRVPSDGFGAFPPPSLKPARTPTVGLLPRAAPCASIATASTHR